MNNDVIQKIIVERGPEFGLTQIDLMMRQHGWRFIRGWQTAKNWHLIVKVA